jgi:nucleoside-diphosphate-sugar epimerase
LHPYAAQAEILWGDLRNPEDARRAVAGVDVVLHIAAIIPPVADHRPRLAQQVNVEGTRNILAAMQGQARPARLVYTSSISVYGDRIAAPFIRVGDPLRPSEGDEYARTKIAAEELVRASGQAWSIFRLCGILTPRLKIQPLMFHMPLATPLEWCHAADAGLALVNAVECPAVDGQIFNLGGGESCRMIARDFLRLMLPIFGVSPAALPIYAFATRNFHSGYYADGDRLDALLRFRRKTLVDYLADLRAGISPLNRALVNLIPRALIRGYFERMSEPLRAIRENNQALIERFYGSRRAFEQLFAQQASA